MARLTDILDDPGLNGVYRLAGPLPELPEVIRLDARQCPDKDGLLEAVGEALRFPDYYGMNWDALEECLFDLSWREGPVLMLVEHADALGQHDLATLVDIWSEAAAAWAEAGRGCVLLLGGGVPPGIPAVDP
jgi:RNAse (barnase) inhibitor barstar